MNNNVLSNLFVIPTRAIFFVFTMLILLICSTCSTKSNPETTPEIPQIPEEQTSDEQTSEEQTSDEQTSEEQTSETYTVSFNTNGGSEVASEKVNSGDTVARPQNPTKTDSIFANWFTDDALTNIYSFSALVTSNFTLYAKWIPQDATIYKVAFNTGGGSEVDTQPIVDGQMVSKPDDPTREGYSFDDWYRTPTFSGEPYKFENTAVTANITLYANWIKTFAVAFDLNIGVRATRTSGDEAEEMDDIPPEVVDSNKKITRPPDPTLEGYRLVHWYIKPEEPSIAYDFENTAVTANTTLYAKWIKTFTVSFWENPFNGTPSTKQTVDTNTTASPPSSVQAQDGFRLSHWFKNLNAPSTTYATAYDFENTAVTENLNLYAYWIRGINVIFNSNGGGEVKSQIVSFRNMATRPPDPSPPSEGLFLSGWFRDDQTFNNKHKFNAPISEDQDITLYAKWEYMVTYDEETRAITGLNPNLPDRDINLFIPANINIDGLNLKMDSIRHEAFSDKTRIVSLRIAEGIKYIGESAFRFTYDAISRRSNSRIAGNLVIPNTIKTIGDGAFEGCAGFSGGLTIPRFVVTIGANAFRGCSNFNGSLIIGSSVVTIGDGAFEGCERFNGRLIIPNYVQTIGANAFLGCRGFNRDLRIGNSVQTIGANAFRGCVRFTSLSFTSNSVETIGDGAFEGCERFSGGLIIPRSVVTIGANAFRGCVGFTSLSLATSNSVVNTIGDGAFDGCVGFTGGLTIPRSVVTIGANAFRGCVNFYGSLIIRESVEIIGNGAFDGCERFAGSLTIPNSVETIGANAFRDCEGFTSLSFTSNSVVNTIGDGAFTRCYFTGKLTIPNSVVTIGREAFMQCDRFTGDLTIPERVVFIGPYAFLECSGFTGSLRIGNSVGTIGDQAFFGCSGFRGSLRIGKSVKVIGESAFFGCSGFRGNLTIPQSVSTIRRHAFVGMRSIGNFIFERPTVPTILVDIFPKSSKFNITVPNARAENTYRGHSVLRKYTDRITVKE